MSNARWLLLFAVLFGVTLVTHQGQLIALRKRVEAVEYRMVGNEENLLSIAERVISAEERERSVLRKGGGE